MSGSRAPSSSAVQAFTSPKSSTVTLPSRWKRKLPGCGSPCMTPKRWIEACTNRKIASAARCRASSPWRSTSSSQPYPPAHSAVMTRGPQWSGTMSGMRTNG